MKWLDHDVLMIPGPSEPYQEVVSTLSQPVLPHYGRKWKQLYDETCSNLQEIFKTKNRVIIVPGCGNTGLELAIANVVEPNDRVILVHDGYFAEVFKELIVAYGGLPIIVSARYGKAVAPKAIAEILEQEENVKAIFTVYNETSTGVKHNLVEIGRIAKEFDLFNIVDAISAFGGMELEVDDWNLDVTVGYPSKALGGIHGVVPVAISNRIWEYVAERKSPIRTRFLNLNLWKKCITDWSSWGHPYPTALPTSVIVALNKTLEIVLNEELESRYLRHRICKSAVRKGVRALNLEPFAEEEEASETVTTFRLPDSLEFGKIISFMQEELNIIVASMNLIDVNGLRIGHMGLTASPHYILPTLFALEVALSKLGWKIGKGEAVKTASEVFANFL